MALAAGDLRHFVVIQRKTVTQDPSTGEQIEAWQDVASVWADMNYQSVREFVAANAEQSEVSGYAAIRFRDDVDAKCRIVHRGKYYGVLGVMPDNESGLERITLALSEGVMLEQ